ncbi:MAG: hypothetical protein WCJ51_02735 [Candidatus Moraniibacteriota bacterium]
MQNKQGNIKMFAIVGVIVAVSVGLIAWFFVTKTRVPATQIVPTQPIAQVAQPQSDSNAIPADWQTYTNEKYGFSFKYPATGYEFHVGRPSIYADEPQFFVKNSNDSDEGYYTFALDVSPNDTQKEFEARIKEFQKNGKYSVATAVGGKPAYKHIYDEVVIYFILDNGNFFTFRCKNNDIGEKILSTLKFTNQSAETVNWQTYKNIPYGFQLTFPESWKGYTVGDATFKHELDISFNVGGKNGFNIFSLSSVPVKYKNDMVIPDQGCIIGQIDKFVILATECCKGVQTTAKTDPFDDFQKARCAEVPSILKTFEIIN